MGPLFWSSIAAVQGAAGCWTGEVTGQETRCKLIHPPSCYSSRTERAGPSQGLPTKSERLPLPLEFIKPANKASVVFLYTYLSLWSMTACFTRTVSFSTGVSLEEKWKIRLQWQLPHFDGRTNYSYCTFYSLDHHLKCSFMVIYFPLVVQGTHTHQSLTGVKMWLALPQFPNRIHLTA